MARILDLTSLSALTARGSSPSLATTSSASTPAGDAIRRLEPHLGAAPRLETGAFHQFLNAGKRSVALDLASDKGGRLLLALIAKADAVVASLPLPLDEDAILAANPALVLVWLDDGPPELCALPNRASLRSPASPRVGRRCSAGMCLIRRSASMSRLLPPPRFSPRRKPTPAKSSSLGGAMSRRLGRAGLGRIQHVRRIPRADGLARRHHRAGRRAALRGWPLDDQRAARAARLGEFRPARPRSRLQG